MTRRNLYSFLIAFIVILSLLVTFFSPYGVVSNIRGEKELERLKEERMQKEAELEILRQKEMSLYDGELEKGETVLVFPSSSYEPESADEQDDVEEDDYFYLPLYLDILISAFLAFFISILPVFNKKKEKKKKERINYDDYT